MRGCQAEVSRGSEEAGLERHQVLCVQQNSDQEKTRYNLYRYIICENLEKVLYYMYIVNDLKEKRNRDSAYTNIFANLWCYSAVSIFQNIERSRSSALTFIQNRTLL